MILHAGRRRGTLLAAAAACACAALYLVTPSRPPPVPAHVWCAHKGASSGVIHPVTPAEFTSSLRRLLLLRLPAAGGGVRCLDMDASLVGDGEWLVGHPADAAAQPPGTPRLTLPALAATLRDAPAPASLLLTLEPKLGGLAAVDALRAVRGLARLLRALGLAASTALVLQEPLAREVRRAEARDAAAAAAGAGKRSVVGVGGEGAEAPLRIALPLRDVDGCVPATTERGRAPLPPPPSALPSLLEALGVAAVMPSVRCWEDARVRAAVAQWQAGGPGRVVSVWVVDSCEVAARTLVGGGGVEGRRVYLVSNRADALAVECGAANHGAPSTDTPPRKTLI